MVVRGEAGGRTVRMNVEVVGRNNAPWEIGIAVNEAAVDGIVVPAWDT
jgi:hypothetical protein